jgi:hypothetical protein
MTKLSAVRAILGIVALVGCAPSVPPDRLVKFVPLRKDCTAGEAIPITLEALASHPDQFIGKCVRTRGLVAFRNIFPSLQSLYEESNPEKRVAIYGKSPPDYELWGMRKFADVIGYAYSCEQLGMNAEIEDQKRADEAKTNGSKTVVISFLAGECHYHGGPVIYVSQIAVDEGAPTRLFGPDATKYANLVRLPPDAPHFTEVASAIAPAFEFVRKQDDVALKAHLEKLGTRNASSETVEAVDPRKSPFAFLLGSSRVPEVHYFVPKRPNAESEGRYLAIGCVCKMDDCERKWPIALSDTVADPDWPYACMTAEKNGSDIFVSWY